MRLIFFLFALSWSDIFIVPSENPLPPKSSATIQWEDFIDAIAMVESRMNCMVQDRTGARNGRGMHQVGESVLQQYKWTHPGSEWITPDMLYNPVISRPIAIWYLYWLDNAFQKYGITEMLIPCVLSGYNAGFQGTIKYGVQFEYVEQVLKIYRTRK